MIYDITNVELLAKKVIGGDVSIPAYQKHYFDKIKKELQVHTEGKLFDKVISVFSNEEPDASKFVIETYETVTKGSIWKGIDNVSRIFNNTGFNIQGDAKAIEMLSNSNFFAEYINDFVTISTAKDPNSLQVWMLEEDSKTWESEMIETQFLLFLSKDEIAFIDVDESEYEISVETNRIARNKFYEAGSVNKVNESYFEGVKYNFGEKKKIVYISKEQYIEFYTQPNGVADVKITTFEKPLLRPYSFTGVTEIAEDVFHSSVAPFIPFGNHALIQHRTYRSVEALFGYPRMSEIELPCDNCVKGMESCDTCEDFPEGIRPCTKCNGSGHLSMQSPFKIYKRKLFPDNPELNVNIKPVDFYTPEIGILNYNKDAWKETLQMGEEALYIQQRVETGNVESAKSREKQLEAMYSWLGRVSNRVYENIQDTINNFCIIHGLGQVTVHKPMSFAIMSELEAFTYLDQIVQTDAPIFIKTTHIENFLNKYVSKTSAIIKIVDILKRVDPFVFYTMKDLQSLSDSGVINDSDWRIHAYSFPLLMQMYSREPELLENEYTYIENALMSEINKKVVTPNVQ